MKPMKKLRTQNIYFFQNKLKLREKENYNFTLLKKEFSELKKFVLIFKKVSCLDTLSTMQASKFSPVTKRRSYELDI